VVFGDDEKRPLIDEERGVFIPAGIVGEDEDSEDPHNCTISES